MCHLVFPDSPPTGGLLSVVKEIEKKNSTQLQPAVFEASLIASDFQISIVDFVLKLALVCHVSLKKLEDPRG